MFQMKAIEPHYRNSLELRFCCSENKQILQSPCKLYDHIPELTILLPTQHISAVQQLSCQVVTVQGWLLSARVSQLKNNHFEKMQKKKKKSYRATLS